MASDLARMQKETSEALHALTEKFKTERAALESQFAQFGQAFEAHRASFEKEFLTEIKSLQDALESAKAQSEEIKNIANGNLSQALGTFEKDITDNLEQRKAAIDKHIDGWLSAMDSKMRKISQDALEQRKAEEARIAQEVNAELKRIRDGLYTQAQKIERDIEAFKNI
jgi:recombinational DNA repair ATPase RecF